MFKSIIGEIVLQMCFSAFKRPSLKSWNKVLPTRLSQQNENQSNWPGKEGQLYYKKVQGLRGNVNAMISWKEFNRVKKIDGVESQKICTVNSAKNHGMSPQVRYILSQINWKWTIQQKLNVLKKLLVSKKVRVEISKRMWMLSHIRYCLWQRKWK